MIRIITELCSIIVDFFIREKIFPEEEREIYQYGFELCVSSVINIVMVLAIGVISGNFWESVIFYIVFCFTRLHTGGFHAPTYLLCKISFVSVFLAILAMDYLLSDIDERCWFAFYIFSLIIVCRFAPVENHNKLLTNREKKRSKIISIIEMAFWLTVMILMFSFGCPLYHTVSLTLFFVADLMLLGKFCERRRNI